ncbi:hypothetical protein N7444_002051 [Penicillium canescens]|nr:hypothetical protein N7444_002051 [Penicillium canescens]KAJ6154951.1 hypothetical protein N7485_013320 [Penicillium canescens]
MPTHCWNNVIHGAARAARWRERPAARKVSATLPTVLRFPGARGARTATLIYSISSGTGSKMEISKDGFLSLIMSMMMSSFAKRLSKRLEAKPHAATAKVPYSKLEWLYHYHEPE